MQRGSYALVSVSSRRDFPALPGNPGCDRNGGAFGQYLKKADPASLAPLQPPPRRDWKRQTGKQEKEPAKSLLQETATFQPAASARAEAAKGLCFWEQGLEKNALEGPDTAVNHIPGPEGCATPLLSPETGGNIMAQIAESIGPLNMTAAQELCLQLQPESWGEVLVHCQAQQDTVLVEIYARHPAVRGLLADQTEALHRLFQEANPGLEHLQIDVSLFANGGEGAPGEVLTAEKLQAFQQLQHDLEFPAWDLGENRPQESPAAVSWPGPENRAGAERLFFTGISDTGETGEKEAPEITLQPTRQGDLLQGEPAGNRIATEKDFTGRNPGAGERKTAGALQAETLLPAEVADQVLNSLQGLGGTVENLEIQGNLRPVSNTPPPTELLEKVILQIVEHTEHRGPFNTPGVQELRLRLQPESLGEVLVRIRRQQGALSAEIITRHTAVQEMLESQLETLRQRFQETNLNVEHLDVLLQDEGKSGFTFSGEGSGRDQPRAPVAGTGAGNAAGEGGNVNPGWRGAGGKVDCLV